MQVRDTMVDYLSLSLPGKRCVFTTLPHSSSPLQQHFPLHTTILLCNTQIERLLTGENHTTVSLHWLFISFSMPTWLRHGSRLISHTWCQFPHPGWQGNRYTLTRGVVFPCYCTGGDTIAANFSSALICHTVTRTLSRTAL